MNADKETGNAKERASTLRILDANLNRATEGLRVAEEFARIVLEDAFLSKRLKEARHALVEKTCDLFSDKSRLTFRDVGHDVGTLISTTSETHRENLRDVAQASFKRAQQAIRSLEEYGKTLSADFAKACETLRYESYTLERAVVGVRDLDSPLEAARVYVLIDGKSDAETFEREARRVTSAADVIQLRDKKLKDAVLLDRAKRLRSITRNSNCLFIMNDRPDIASLADADGVHVGQDELGVREARQILGEKASIGVSTHSIEQLRKAVLDGANYLGCGPVFASGTKSFEQFPGVEFLREAALETSLPSFAIGGIGLENLDCVIEAGFKRIAVQGSLLHANMSPSEVIMAMKERLR